MGGEKERKSLPLKVRIPPIPLEPLRRLRNHLDIPTWFASSHTLAFYFLSFIGCCEINTNTYPVTNPNSKETIVYIVQ